MKFIPSYELLKSVRRKALPSLVDPSVLPKPVRSTPSPPPKKQKPSPKELKPPVSQYPEVSFFPAFSVDSGSKAVGLALMDEKWSKSYLFTVIRRSRGSQFCDALLHLMSGFKCHAFLIGYPRWYGRKKTSGHAESVIREMDTRKELDDILYTEIDESGTSEMAKPVQKKHLQPVIDGKYTAKEKGDMLAAAYIYERFIVLVADNGGPFSAYTKKKYSL